MVLRTQKLGQMQYGFIANKRHQTKFCPFAANGKGLYL